ncbi:hypothetical protein ACEYYB_10140 [Paracoccus sp. p4-l81]|uniref:baeRF11 domain-containing protein n=1 Tax=unclassified Paracoccus (in: a-proteobacteria) TaxID=2688777 RepID=UPI0035B9FC10
MLHLDIPTRDQINRLTAARAEPSVTIYLPTTPLTQHIDQSRIELKNLRKEAVEQLQAAGVDKRAIWPIEEQIEAIEEDDDFWTHQAHSLAVLVTPEKIRTFRLANKLEASVHVSDRFHLKPLLRATTFGNNAYVLALAEGGIRLIDVPAQGEATEVRVPDMPKDAYDALGTTTLNDRAHSRRQVGDEGKNMRLRQYVRIVDQALMKVLRHSERPLILAAADPLENLFRAAASYDHLAPRSIEGNPEHKSPAELAEAARPILTKVQAAEVEDVRALYAERASASRATTDLSTIARAATHGAVEALMFDIDAVTPGTIDDDGVIQIDDRDDAHNYGIGDEIVARAMNSGARIIAVRKDDLPGGDSGLAAILRWPV